MGTKVQLTARIYSENDDGHFEVTTRANGTDLVDISWFDEGNTRQSFVYMSTEAARALGAVLRDLLGEE